MSVTFEVPISVPAAADSRREPEQERNRVLRRADWRFLLPTPSPQKSICLTGGPLAEAVKAISACTVDPTGEEPGGDCDLAVAADPDRRMLRRAWTALRPGGACYVEWRSLASGSPAVVRRRLERAGWVDVACYAARPDPAHEPARAWVPLDGRAAVRFYLGQHPAADGLLSGVRQAGRRVLWRSTPWLFHRAPLCVVARKPKSVHASPDFRAWLLETVRTHGGTGEREANPHRISTLLLTGGPRSVSKIVGLVFAEPSRRPLLVVKLPRVPEAVPLLDQEATTLLALEQHLAGVSGAPRVLFAGQHEGIFVLGETVVAGEPLRRILEPENLRELALLITDWAAGLFRSPHPVPPTDWRDRLVEPVLATFERSFGTVLDRGMLRETIDLLATIGPLPLVVEHRDLSPWNVLLDPLGKPAVLDWEGAELRGLPALDLVYFLTYAAFHVDRAFDTARQRAAYRTSLDPSTHSGSVSRECLERYVARAGVPAEALRPLRLFVWLLHSRSEYRRLVEDAGGAPEPAALRRSLFLGLWEEELRCGRGA